MNDVLQEKLFFARLKFFKKFFHHLFLSQHIIHTHNTHTHTHTSSSRNNTNTNTNNNNGTENAFVGPSSRE